MYMLCSSDYSAVANTKLLATITGINRKVSLLTAMLRTIPAATAHVEMVYSYYRHLTRTEAKLKQGGNDHAQYTPPLLGFSEITL